jgi:signal transduction histidine kinase/HPt (histidine-containing phosphotransfer) domain-containing protein
LRLDNFDDFAVRILIVEDNHVDFFLEIKNLQADGIVKSSVTRAYNLSEAKTMLQTQRFDIILLDMNLGDSFGLQTFAELSQVVHDIPIVILSGAQDDETVYRAVGMGAQDYVSKDNLDRISLKKVIIFALERHSLRTAVNQAREEAVRHAEFKSRFLAQMSHEIRTPMNAVIGTAEILSHSPTLSASDRELVKTLISSGNYLIELISDILDISKAEANKLELHHEPFNIRNLVEDTCLDFSAMASSKGLTLSTFVHPTVASQYVGDASRIRQVLSNLLSNAIKYTEQGTISVRVESSDGAHGETLVFRVIDTGPGMTPEQRARLFQPYAQLDESNPLQALRGTGLGLMICRALIDKMGGIIDVETAPNQGSSFWFSIQLERAPYRQSERQDLNSTRVTIVSSDQDRAEILREIIASRGMLPVIASPTELWAARNRSSHETHAEIFIMDGADHPPIDSGVRTLTLDRLTGGIFQQRLYREIVDRLAHSESDAQRSNSSTLGDEQRPILQGRNFLVVDDHKVNRDVVTRMLHILGARCEQAESGEQALARLRQPQEFDVVLMDCQMPGMDGFETTRAIREQLPHPLNQIPIIALTANAFAEDRQRCQKAGMDGFLAKPVTLADLQHALVAACQLDRAKSYDANSMSDGEMPSELPILDATTIAGLRQLELPGSDGGFLRELVSTYSTDTPEIFGNLLLAVSRKDDRQIRHFAHKLKGISRNLGAARVSSICAEIEDQALQNIHPSERELVMLKHELQHAQEELKRLVATT